MVRAALVAVAMGGCKRQPPAAPPVAPSPPAPVAAAPAPPPSPALPPRAPHAPYKHVVIISEDGLRPDALMHVLPPVHQQIMARAAYSLQARTIRRASTLPAHAAMLSGFDVKEHGLYWNSWHPERGWIHVPTVFDEVEKNGGTAAAFVGKKKLEHIAHPGSVDMFSRPGYFCKKVVDEASKYLVEKRPQIEFIHFSDPDDLGHSQGWMSDSQFGAVRHTDKCLQTLLDAVAQAGLDKDTLFILSADHGGHGHNHSGKIKEDRLIPWIAWGPGVRPGHKIQAPISTVDTAATALWALGYANTPGAIGHPVLEAFDPQTVDLHGPQL
ncbi:MAG TPA: alkaline phosphatase [Polyangia bacterium]|nr:alkaline phosphatase [Polyangia bacterium]